MGHDMHYLCPVCGQATTYRMNPFRPFCSRTCKDKDFLKWVEGEYRIPSQPCEDDIRESENDE